MKANIKSVTLEEYQDSHFVIRTPQALVEIYIDDKDNFGINKNQTRIMIFPPKDRQISSKDKLETIIIK